MRLAFALLSLAALAAGSALPLAPPAAAQERPRTFHGTLQPCANGHRVRLRAGRRYTITANSTAFDTVVRLYRRGGDAVLAQDDDGGEGNNSQLSFAPGETGEYLICVASFGAGGTGAYTVGVEPAGPMPPPITAATRTETVTRRVYEGTLAEGDARDGGSWFDDYQIDLRPGQRVLISVESGAFDTLLKVYRAELRGGETVATDDDGGGGLNSMLVLAPDREGSFIVRVTSYSGGTGGAYRLRIDN